MVRNAPPGGVSATIAPYHGRSMSTTTSLILDRNLVADIRRIEHATGRNNIYAGCVSKLEESVAEFGSAFAACVARGDTGGAARAAHTLKGASRQLGAQAL